MKNHPFNPQQDTIDQLKAEIFRLQKVIENLPGSIYWKDKNGVYLGRNTYSQEKMQSSNLESTGQRDAVIGKTDYELFSKEVADQYRKHDLEVMQTQTELSLEEPITLPDGKTIIQLSTKKPLYNEQGEVDGIVGNTVDITHLKEIEDELRQAKEKSEHSSNMIKTEFMRNMEHDIRTPFCGVWGIANYLWERETDLQKKEYLNDITLCAKELLDYCNGILDFSKIELGMLAVLDKKFSLEDLINSAIMIEMPAAKQKRLELIKDYDKNIPSILIGDRYRLSRTLINLLSNAIKFTEEGNVTLDVTLINKTDRKVLIRIVVKDTGIGIPEEKKEYIFEKFSRLSPSYQGFYKGIGLGLRIVKQFMHEMEGEIDLISEVGKGTQFICTIPFKSPLTNDFVEPE